MIGRANVTTSRIVISVGNSDLAYGFDTKLSETAEIPRMGIDCSYPRGTLKDLTDEATRCRNGLSKELARCLILI